jgi:hypothetical protein
MIKVFSNNKIKLNLLKEEYVVKKSKRVTLLSILLIVALLIGCSNGTEQKENSTDNSTGETNTITTLKWGTASLGSTAQMVGSAIGTVINSYEPNLKITVQTTGGATENPRSMYNKQLDICHVNDPHSASNGIGPFEGEPKVELWALFTMYPNEIVFVTLEDSPIKSVADFVDKRISTGPPGSGTSQNTKAIITEYGIWDKIKNSNLGYNESVDALKDGTVDAIALYSNFGTPSPAMAQLDQSTDYKLVEMDEKILEAVYEKYPDYGPMPVKAGSYKAAKEDFYTLASFSSEMADSRMSDEVAYTFVKNIYEHLDELAKYHAMCQNFSLETALSGVPKGVPVHPGAAKYYQEKGVWRDDLTIGVR